MNKLQLIKVLECCLLSFEGLPEKELIQLTNPESAKIGIKICGLMKRLGEIQSPSPISNKQEAIK